jgi:hypothetical protein
MQLYAAVKGPQAGRDGVAIATALHAALDSPRPAKREGRKGAQQLEQKQNHCHCSDEALRLHGISALCEACAAEWANWCAIEAACQAGQEEVRAAAWRVYRMLRAGPRKRPCVTVHASLSCVMLHA